jgi:hypothetical protein
LAVPWRFKKRLYEEEEEKNPQTRINTRGRVPYLELLELDLEQMKTRYTQEFHKTVDKWNERFNI